VKMYAQKTEGREEGYKQSTRSHAVLVEETRKESLAGK